jgi:phage repressor protein C with HTH and peptisase S24 domain
MFPTFQVGNFMLPTKRDVCEATNMVDISDLRGKRLYDSLIALKPGEMAETDWAVLAGLNRGFFSNLKSGEGSPRLVSVRKLLNAIGKTEADLDPNAPPAPPPAKRTSNLQIEMSPVVERDFDMVEIQQIDLAYGMGGMFTDVPIEIDVLKFPKIWVETITYSPPGMLTWARGRGDSMLPTIHDGDVILLDRSQTRVTEQDAIWAFTVGDVGSRVKGDRYVILSDNPSVPDDEERQEFVRIVGRVVFVGAKK